LQRNAVNCGWTNWEVDSLHMAAEIVGLGKTRKQDRFFFDIKYVSNTLMFNPMM
jgi:hypothetical protein